MELSCDYEETARVAKEWISRARDVPTVPLASAEELEAARFQAEGADHGLVEAASFTRVLRRKPSRAWVFSSPCQRSPGRCRAASRSTGLRPASGQRWRSKACLGWP